MRFPAVSPGVAAVGQPVVAIMAFSCARPRSTLPAPIPFFAAVRHEHTEDQPQRALRRIPDQCRGDVGPGRRSARQDRPGRGRRRRGRARQACRPRQAAAARARAHPARCGLAVSRAVAARRPRHVRQRGALRRHHHRHRPHPRPGMHGGGERRHGERRHLFPDDGEKAFARAGNRGAEQPALHLPGGFGRRQPAHLGRGVSGPRALRPHFLQPGQYVGRRHPADRGGDGLVHRRRRLCAGDVGRSRHRQGTGHDFPRRAAAGESRHRRNRHTRGTRRRRGAHAPVRRRRPLRAERCARPVDRPHHRRQPQPRETA